MVYLWSSRAVCRNVNVQHCCLFDIILMYILCLFSIRDKKICLCILFWSVCFYKSAPDVCKEALTRHERHGALRRHTPISQNIHTTGEVKNCGYSVAPLVHSCGYHLTCSPTQTPVSDRCVSCIASQPENTEIWALILRVKAAWWRCRPITISFSSFWD